MQQVVKVSDHALQRYRERFGPRSMTEEVVAMFRRSSPAPAWIRKQVSQTEMVDKTAVVEGTTVMIVAVRDVPEVGVSFTTIVSVLPLDWFESQRKTKSQHRKGLVPLYRRGRRRV